MQKYIFSDIPYFLTFAKDELISVHFRQYRYEQKLARRLWTIDFKELRNLRPLPPLGQMDSSLPYQRRRSNQNSEDENREHDEQCALGAKKKLEKKRKLRLVRISMQRAPNSLPLLF